jgi:hypothetical protein
MALGMGLGMAFARTQVVPSPQPEAPVFNPQPSTAFHTTQASEESSIVRESYTLHVTPTEEPTVNEASSTSLSEQELIQWVNNESATDEQVAPNLESLLTFDLPQEAPAETTSMQEPIFFELANETVANELEENTVAEQHETIEAPIAESNTNDWGMQVHEVELKDDFVTIDGVTINRRKGNRYMTDDEIATQVNFELQKRAFDDRAARLRSLSFDVTRADISNADDDTPAYLRRNKPLDETPSSNEDVYSNVQVAQNGTTSSINTLNTFLHGNNPD